MEHDSILIRNGWIVTMNPEREILRGNLYLENGRIKELPSVRQTADIVIDADGRIHVAVMPRGVRNCSDELITRSRRFAEDNGLLLHTHVSENGWLSEHLKKTTGLSDMELLEQQHMARDRLIIAHGVWLSISTAALLGRQNRAALCAAQSTIPALTRSIAIDYAPYNIRANFICTGSALSSLSDGNWEDAANAAVFLASDEATFMTGTSICADGGLTETDLGRSL